MERLAVISIALLVITLAVCTPLIITRGTGSGDGGALAVLSDPKNDGQKPTAAVPQPERAISVLLNGRELLLIEERQGYMLKHTSLEEVVGLVTNVSENVRVHLHRRGVPDEAIEDLVVDTLLNAGLTEEAVVWEGHSEAWLCSIDEFIAPRTDSSVDFTMTTELPPQNDD